MRRRATERLNVGVTFVMSNQDQCWDGPARGRTKPFQQVVAKFKAEDCVTKVNLSGKDDHQTIKDEDQESQDHARHAK